MNNNKRAMTAVVATVILVALVIIAIGIVSVVIFGIVDSGANEASNEAKCLGTIMKIDNATKDVDGIYTIRVSRISGSEEISGVAITLISDTNANSNISYKVGDVASGAGSVVATIATDTYGYLADANKVKATAYFNGTNIKYCSASQEVKIA